MKTSDKSKLTGKKTGGYQSIPHAFGRQPRDLPLFSFYFAQCMLIDPTIKLGLAMRAAPLCQAEFAYKEGETWKPGIRAEDDFVAAFVERNLKRIWQNYLPGLLDAQIWGWAASEVIYRPTSSNMVEIHGLLHRHSNDVRAIVSSSHCDRRRERESRETRRRRSSCAAISAVISEAPTIKSTGRFCTCIAGPFFSLPFGSFSCLRFHCIDETTSTNNTLADLSQTHS